MTAFGVRLWQAADLHKRVVEGRPIKAATLGIMFVDLGDGILARLLGIDGPRRRAMDSVADAAQIVAGMSATYRKNPVSRPYIGVLAAREAFVASGWMLDLAKTGQVKKSDDYHKAAPNPLVAFGYAANNFGEGATHVTGALAVGVNVALAYDHARSWLDPSRNTMLDTGVEQVPGFQGARDAIRQRFSFIT